MKIEYEWTREDLKKKLDHNRKIPNIIFMILGTLFYFYVTYYGFILDEFDPKYLILGFFIYAACLVIILFLITKLYIFFKLRRNDKKTSKAYGTYYVEVDKDYIKSTINNEIISYKWDDITKFKNKKNYFFLATKKDKIGLLFCKSILKEENYNKLYKYVKDKLK